MTERKEIRKGVLFDAFTMTVPTLPEEHLLIHAGKLWEAQHMFASIDSGNSGELFIQTGKSRNLLHTLITFSSSLLGDFYIYEDTEKTYASGNAITSQNRSRYEPFALNDAPQVCHTPGGSGDGTLIFQGIIGGGVGPRNFGGSGRDANELLLKQNTAYLLRFTSRAASNRAVITVEYYERFHTDADTTTTTTTTA